MEKFMAEEKGFYYEYCIRLVFLCLISIALIIGGVYFKVRSDYENSKHVATYNETIDTAKYDRLVEMTNSVISYASEITEESTPVELEVEEESIEVQPTIKIMSPVKLMNTNNHKYFTADMDIGAGMSGVTAEMLDAATEHFSKYQNFENPFLGKGWIFIEAQEKSGIDALWIYSIAVFESGWGQSKIARERANYFGIGAWDIDMERSKYMGDDLYTGIVNGAIWIAENYYNKGQNTTASMNSVPYHSYAPGNEKWVPNIVDFMNTFYKNWRNNGNER